LRRSTLYRAGGTSPACLL